MIPPRWRDNMKSQGIDILKRKVRERGSILIVATLVIVVMLILAIPFLFKLSAQFRSTERSYRALSAFNLAEAAVDRVFWEMNQIFSQPGGIITIDENGNTIFGPESEAVGDWTGQFEGIITENLDVIPNTRIIVSTGRMPFIDAGTVDRTVQVVLEKYFKSIWDFGFFVDESFLTMTNFLLDSYDSRLGSYGGENVGSMGYFGTNNYEPDSWVINQGSSSEINGAVAAGWETDPDNLDDVIDIPSGTQGEYETMILSSEFELPSVNIFDLPPKDMFGHQGDESMEDWFTGDFKSEYLTFDDISQIYNYQKQDFMVSSGDINTGYFKGTLSLGKNRDRTLTSSDNGVYTSFIMERNSTVTIDGHVVIYITGVEGEANTGTFFNDGGKIYIAEGGSLTMILGNSSLGLVNNTDVNYQNNVAGSPADCIILGTDQFNYYAHGQGNLGLMKMDNNVHISAAIYIPRGDIVTAKGEANVRLYGAAISNSMDMSKANIDFHYDEALADLMMIKGGVPYWKVVSWQERVGQ